MYVLYIFDIDIFVSLFKIMFEVNVALFNISFM